MASSATKLSVIPKISRISPLVTRILGCNPSPMTLQGTNTYVIGTGKRRLLIDTADGTKPEYFQNLKSFLHDEGAILSTIVLTHWHPDHVGGIEELVKTFGKDAAIVKYPRKGEEDVSFGNDISYSYIDDNHKFDVEGANLKAVYTPGHTTDHIMLHLEEENALFSGDCILGEGTAVFEDLFDYMKSLRKVLDIDPNVIYPAHGAIIQDPVVRIKYYIEHREQRESQIVSALELNHGKTLSPMDIVKIVYKETPEVLHMAAAKNVSHHLTKLHKEGRIKQSEEDTEAYFVESLPKPSL